MKTIWKFPLRVDDEQVIEIPMQAQTLPIQMQRGIPCFWALVDTAWPRVRAKIYTVGTGHSITFDVYATNYLGSYQLADGGLVFHVFIGDGEATT